MDNSMERKDRRYDVLALGELLVDFTTTIPSTTDANAKHPSPPSLRGDAGGAPANVLAAVSKLGGTTGFIGKVGTDPFGTFLSSSLEHFGIDTRGLKSTSQTLTTLAFVTLTSSGERSFSFQRSPGADTQLDIDDIDPMMFRETHIFHFGSLSMTHEPARSATLYAARLARESSCIVSYDPNWRPPLWVNRDEAIQQMLNGLRGADIVKVSEEEMALLTGTEDIRQGAQQLLETGPVLVLVTLGERGCWYESREFGGGLVPSIQIQAVDTTGAGDAFMGGFLWRLSQAMNRSSSESSGDATIAQNAGTLATTAVGKSGRPNVSLPWSKLDLEEAIAFANVMGALTASRAGTMSAMPSYEEVLKYVSG